MALRASRRKPGVLASFIHVDAAADAIRDFMVADGFTTATGTTLIEDPTQVDLYGTPAATSTPSGRSGPAESGTWWSTPPRPITRSKRRWRTG